MLGFLLLPFFIFIYIITMASESSTRHKMEREENTCPHCGRYNRSPKYSYEDGADVYSCKYCGERIRSTYN